MRAAVVLLSSLLGAARALPNPTFLSNKASGQQATEPCGNPDDFGPWTVMASCNAPRCGTGVEVRSRLYIGGPPLQNLADCIFQLTPCSDVCPPVNCEVSDWTDYSRCSAPCGGGIQYRTRLITTPALYGGAPCPGSESLVTVRTCNEQSCPPIDCVVSDWSQWTDCSGPCGTTDRKRSVIIPAEYGARPCPTLCETLPCRVAECNTHQSPAPEPVDCKVSDWVYSPCSAVCKRTATRSITTPPLYGGAACPELSLEETCSDGDCPAANQPVNCVLSGYSLWTTCNSECKQTRARTIVVHPANGGSPCPGQLVQETDCIGGDCPRP